MTILISGGGTGGHIFPAIAIADAIKKSRPDIQIQFVGALGKMEMEKVPLAGYPIIGLPIRGFQRKFSFQNIILIFRLMQSLFESKSILKKFKPSLAIGVGGYASGPLLRMAILKKVPILIQEQNSFPGITNRLLAKKAEKICVAFENMERFFPKEKIIETGNPVRQDLSNKVDRNIAFNHFGLDPKKKTIGIFGGSLGARTLNQIMADHAEQLKRLTEIQFIWQVGKAYQTEFEKLEIATFSNVKMLAFIDRMDFAYAICDIVVSRAGALTLAELMVTEKPAILVPSPNVSEDHQRKNADAFVQKNAAWMVLDKEAKQNLWDKMMDLKDDNAAQENMKINLRKMAKPNAADEIAQVVMQIIENRK